MGTSTHNIGQKGHTPLVPSWLEQPNTENLLNTEKNEIYSTPIGEQNRFTQPRGEFTRYINSNGRDVGMAKRSIANYVRNSMGGSRNATLRLGAARNSSSRLLNITSIFASGGTQAVEQYLSLENLSKKNAMDALLTITDFVCPDGGPQDEGIARNAYITAIEETPEIASIPFEELTAEQMLLIVQKSMANVICSRIINDIGNKIIMLPKNMNVAEKLVIQIKEFIKGAISDAISKLNVDVNNLSQRKSIDIVDAVYQTTFEIIAEVGDDE
ncbi:Qat anti-phage system associated protein QatB [Megamonas hypermegale]|uniref:Qat anti-phage system associated protein QatB n=1 Tax=Megamonas hypermegale TaxID=158847 RepID=UPI00195E8F2C|nr:Qat anti-phage system associated protein QatB [Megamonas hypermegale]MBM6760422.1 hypothetical protein [Megamonas hypermegale]